MSNSNATVAANGGEDHHDGRLKMDKQVSVEASLLSVASTTPLTEGSNPNDEDAEKPVVEIHTETNYYFGIRVFHPSWLQIFANKKFFVVLTCFVGLLHTGLVRGFIPVIISSLERRYSFGSTEAGVLIAVFDAVVAVSVVFVSYLGGKSHKPKFIGIFTIIIGIGAFVFASPQFLFGSYSSSDAESYSANSTASLCNGSIDSENDGCLTINAGAYSILVIGVILIGLGSAPVDTVIPAYIDEIVYPKYMSISFAAFLVSSVLGPVIAFGVGSLFLSVYVDPWSSTDLTPEDPTWVGAWWVGPIFFGILLILVGIPFLMFPRYLPDSHLVREERAKELVKVYSSKYANEDNITIIFKTFPIHIKQLLLNPSYMFMCFGLAAAFIVKDGLIGFGAKYVETIFSLTATQSGLVAGAVSIIGAVLGILIGAGIVFAFKLKSRQAAAVAWIILLITIPATFIYFVRCPSSQVAGISVPYADGSQSGEDSSSCAMACNCESITYAPVCGADGLSYFSACRAGCASQLMSDGGTMMYQNCSCIAESLGNVTTLSDTAVDGLCNGTCYALWIFMVLITVLICLLLVIEVPYYYATLRVVAEEQRPLALGLQSLIFRAFGSIPGPLLFGVVFDVSCLSFNYECGKRGNCWIYDNEDLSVNAFGLTIPCIVVSTVLLFLHWFFYPKLNDDKKGDKPETIEMSYTKQLQET